MKALLLTDYKQLELVDLPVPEIGSADVLVRVRACGICGSDVHGYDGSTGRRIPPIVMGHEAAGEVVEVGSAVTDLRPGERVTFDSTVYCGNCFFCHRGEINLCDNRQVLGVSCTEYRRMGAFAEYVSVPRRIVHPLPPDLPFKQAALVEATAVAVHAVNLTPIALGDTGVVVGSGMIGQLALQALKLGGCTHVIAVDVDDARLCAAAKLGADVTINSAKEDAGERVRSLTGGRGADAAIEAVGSTSSIQTALDCVRKGGALTIVGNISPQIDLSLQIAVTRQIRLQGSCASAGEYPACLDAMARGLIRVDSLLSATGPLESGPEWFERLHHREPGLIKVVLEP